MSPCVVGARLEARQHADIIPVLSDLQRRSTLPATCGLLRLHDRLLGSRAAAGSTLRGLGPWCWRGPFLLSDAGRMVG